MTPLVFSPKQRRVLTWWRPGSTDCGHQALICGGAVRSGKTLCAGLSFLCWATLTFQGRRFALCGKTIQSVRRNLWSEVQPVLRALGFPGRNGSPGGRSPCGWESGKIPFSCSVDRMSGPPV